MEPERIPTCENFAQSQNDAAPVLENAVQRFDFCSGCDSFFCSDEDNLQAAAVLRSLERHDAVILYGPSGVGKSHAARGFLGEHSLLTGKTLKVAPADEIIREIVDHSGNPEYAVNSLSRDDVILIDDAFVLSGKTHTQMCFFEIISELVENGKSVVLIADEPNQFDPAFWQAFESLDRGILVGMKYPSAAVKEAYVRFQAERFGLDLAADAVRDLAADARTISQIKGVLSAIHAGKNLL